MRANFILHFSFMFSTIVINNFMLIKVFRTFRPRGNNQDKAFKLNSDSNLVWGETL